MTIYPPKVQAIFDDLVHRRKYQVTLCGSRYTCAPPPEESDWDFLVYTNRKFSSDDMVYFEELGFSLEGSEHYRDAADAFMSWRSDGDINLIVTHNAEFVVKHKLATTVCKKLNLQNKEDRVMLFQAILYGNFPTDEEIPF